MILDASSLYILLKRKELKALGDSVTLDLAFYEVGNSLLKELRRKLINTDSFRGAISVLGGLGELMIVRNFRELDAERISTISKSTGLTFYDASYLTLALATNEDLATNDKELTVEAQKLGVRTVSI